MRAELDHLRPERVTLVRISEQRGLITISVTTGSGELGRRTIDAGSASCPQIVRAASLALDLALADLELSADSSATPPAAEPTTEVVPASPATVDPPVPGPVLPSAPPIVDRAERPNVDAGRSWQAGASFETGLALAFTTVTSMVAGISADVAYAAGERWAPEVSGRGGVFVAFPSRTEIDEREVRLSAYAPRIDGCGGIRGPKVRIRGCASALGGALVGSGDGTEALLMLGGRLEGTWRASGRIGLFLAVDALSMLWPRAFLPPQSAESEITWYAQPVYGQETSPISLLFSTGVTTDWL